MINLQFGSAEVSPSCKLSVEQTPVVSSGGGASRPVDRGSASSIAAARPFALLPLYPDAHSPLEARALALNALLDQRRDQIRRSWGNRCAEYLKKVEAAQQQQQAASAAATSENALADIIAIAAVGGTETYEAVCSCIRRSLLAIIATSGTTSSGSVPTAVAVLLMAQWLARASKTFRRNFLPAAVVHPIDELRRMRSEKQKPNSNNNSSSNVNDANTTAATTAEDDQLRTIVCVSTREITVSCEKDWWCRIEPATGFSVTLLTMSGKIESIRHDFAAAADAPQQEKDVDSALAEILLLRGSKSGQIKLRTSRKVQWIVSAEAELLEAVADVVAEVTPLLLLSRSAPSAVSSSAASPSAAASTGPKKKTTAAGAASASAAATSNDIVAESNNNNSGSGSDASSVKKLKNDAAGVACKKLFAAAFATGSRSNSVNNSAASDEQRESDGDHVTVLTPLPVSPMLKRWPVLSRVASFATLVVPGCSLSSTVQYCLERHGQLSDIASSSDAEKKITSAISMLRARMVLGTTTTMTTTTATTTTIPVASSVVAGGNTSGIKVSDVFEALLHEVSPAGAQSPLISEADIDAFLADCHSYTGAGTTVLQRVEWICKALSYQQQQQQQLASSSSSSFSASAAASSRRLRRKLLRSALNFAEKHFGEMLVGTTERHKQALDRVVTQLVALINDGDVTSETDEQGSTLVTPYLLKARCKSLELHLRLNSVLASLPALSTESASALSSRSTAALLSRYLDFTAPFSVVVAPVQQNAAVVAEENSPESAAAAAAAAANSSSKHRQLYTNIAPLALSTSLTSKIACDAQIENDKWKVVTGPLVLTSTTTTTGSSGSVTVMNYAAELRMTIPAAALTEKGVFGMALCRGTDAGPTFSDNSFVVHVTHDKGTTVSQGSGWSRRSGLVCPTPLTEHADLRIAIAPSQTQAGKFVITPYLFGMPVTDSAANGSTSSTSSSSYTVDAAMLPQLRVALHQQSGATQRCRVELHFVVATVPLSAQQQRLAAATASSSCCCVNPRRAQAMQADRTRLAADFERRIISCVTHNAMRRGVTERLLVERLEALLLLEPARIADPANYIETLVRIGNHVRHGSGVAAAVARLAVSPGFPVAAWSTPTLCAQTAASAAAAAVATTPQPRMTQVPWNLLHNISLVPQDTAARLVEKTSEWYAAHGTTARPKPFAVRWDSAKSSTTNTNIPAAWFLGSTSDPSPVTFTLDSTPLQQAATTTGSSSGSGSSTAPSPYYYSSASPAPVPAAVVPAAQQQHQNQRLAAIGQSVSAHTMKIAFDFTVAVQDESSTSGSNKKMNNHNTIPNGVQLFVGFATASTVTAALLTSSHHLRDARQVYAIPSDAVYIDSVQGIDAGSLRRSRHLWASPDHIFVPGDIVTLSVDLWRRNVSAFRNGHYLGVVFNNVAPQCCDGSTELCPIVRCALPQHHQHTGADQQALSMVQSLLGPGLGQDIHQLFGAAFQAALLGAAVPSPASASSPSSSSASDLAELSNIKCKICVKAWTRSFSMDQVQVVDRHLAALVAFCLRRSGFAPVAIAALEKSGLMNELAQVLLNHYSMSAATASSTSASTAAEIAAAAGLKLPPVYPTISQQEQHRSYAELRKKQQQQQMAMTSAGHLHQVELHAQRQHHRQVCMMLSEQQEYREAQGEESDEGPPPSPGATATMMAQAMSHASSHGGADDESQGAVSAETASAPDKQQQQSEFIHLASYLGSNAPLNEPDSPRWVFIMQLFVSLRFSGALASFCLPHELIVAVLSAIAPRQAMAAAPPGTLMLIDQLASSSTSPAAPATKTSASPWSASASLPLLQALQQQSSDDVGVAASAGTLLLPYQWLDDGQQWRVVGACASQLRMSVGVVDDATDPSLAAGGGGGFIRGTGEDEYGKFSVTGRFLDAYSMRLLLAYDWEPEPRKVTARPGGGGGDDDDDNNKTRQEQQDADAAAALAAAEEESDIWACEACTLENPKTNARCEVCNTPRKGQLWACAVCTYAYNTMDSPVCNMCGSARPGQGRGGLRGQGRGGGGAGARGDDDGGAGSGYLTDLVLRCRGCKKKQETHRDKPKPDCAQCGGNSWMFASPVFGELRLRFSAEEVVGQSSPPSPAAAAAGEELNSNKIVVSLCGTLRKPTTDLDDIELQAGPLSPSSPIPACSNFVTRAIDIGAERRADRQRPPLGTSVVLRALAGLMIETITPETTVAPLLLLQQQQQEAGDIAAATATENQILSLVAVIARAIPGTLSLVNILSSSSAAAAATAAPTAGGDGDENNVNAGAPSSPSRARNNTSINNSSNAPVVVDPSAALTNVLQEIVAVLPVAAVARLIRLCYAQLWALRSREAFDSVYVLLIVMLTGSPQQQLTFCQAMKLLDDEHERSKPETLLRALLRCCYSLTEDERRRAESCVNELKSKMQQQQQQLPLPPARGQPPPQQLGGTVYTPQNPVSQQRQMQQAVSNLRYRDLHADGGEFVHRICDLVAALLDLFQLSPAAARGGGGGGGSGISATTVQDTSLLALLASDRRLSENTRVAMMIRASSSPNSRFILRPDPRVAAAAIVRRAHQAITEASSSSSSSNQAEPTSTSNSMPGILNSNLTQLLSVFHGVGTSHVSCEGFVHGLVQGSGGPSCVGGEKGYFEIVLPSGHRYSQMRQGWGTPHMARGGITQVGASFDSAAYNCKNLVHVMGGDGEYVPPRHTQARDVVGCLLDGTTFSCCWSLNGMQMGPVSVAGIMESGKVEMVPYVSGSCSTADPIEIRTVDCLYVPLQDGYKQGKNILLSLQNFAEEEEHRRGRAATATVATLSYDVYSSLNSLVGSLLLEGFEMSDLLFDQVSAYSSSGAATAATAASAASSGAAAAAAATAAPLVLVRGRTRADAEHAAAKCAVQWKALRERWAKEIEGKALLHAAQPYLRQLHSISDLVSVCSSLLRPATGAALSPASPQSVAGLPPGIALPPGAQLGTAAGGQYGGGSFASISNALAWHGMRRAWMQQMRYITLPSHRWTAFERLASARLVNRGGGPDNLPRVEIDMQIARHYYADSKRLPSEHSVLEQLMAQVGHSDRAFLLPIPYTVRWRNCIAEDRGGLLRATYSAISDEIMGRKDESGGVNSIINQAQEASANAIAAASASRDRGNRRPGGGVGRGGAGGNFLDDAAAMLRVIAASVQAAASPVAAVAATQSPSRAPAAQRAAAASPSDEDEEAEEEDEEWVDEGDEGDEEEEDDEEEGHRYGEDEEGEYEDESDLREAAATTTVHAILPTDSSASGPFSNAPAGVPGAADAAAAGRRHRREQQHRRRNSSDENIDNQAAAAAEEEEEEEERRAAAATSSSSAAAEVQTRRRRGTGTAAAAAAARVSSSEKSDDKKTKKKGEEGIEKEVPASFCRLFVPNSHTTFFNVVPDVKATSERDLAVYRFIGRLLGSITLSGHGVLNVSFPRMFWMYLLDEEVTVDHYAFDVCNSVMPILSDDEALLDNDQFHSVFPQAQQFYKPPVNNNNSNNNHSGSGGGGSLMQHQQSASSDAMQPSSGSSASMGAGSPVPPRHAATPVTLGAPISPIVPSPVTNTASSSSAAAGGGGHGHFGRVASSGAGSSANMDCLIEASEALKQREIAARRKAAEQSLIHKYDVQLAALRAGFESICPRDVTAELTWFDIERRCCGTPAASISAADSVKWFDATALGGSKLAAYFEAALLELTADQRSNLLVFCTGQRCLPLPERIVVTCGTERHRFPTAHTCSPIALVLQPYESAEELRVKLLAATSHYNDFSFV